MQAIPSKCIGTVILAALLAASPVIGLAALLLNATAAL